MKHLQKTLDYTKRSAGGHWVGDGFPVQSIFSYTDIAEDVSPFLLLDYAQPVEFPPTTAKLGVGQHPHRGFETVTIVYDGGVSHRDSSGGGGTIGKGDVQWMTAASGLIHEEFHSPEYARSGGPFEMIQLWVNLPAKHKMAKPGYQGITADRIPVVELADGAGTARVIAGSLGGAHGPARTFTPMEVYDLGLVGGHRVGFDLTDGHTTALFVLDGRIRVGGSDSEPVRTCELAVMSRAGDRVEFEVLADTRLLLLAGEPLDEPIVGHGPFVMNTRAEIETAIRDYHSGRFGQIVG